MLVSLLLAGTVLLGGCSRTVDAPRQGEGLHATVPSVVGMELPEAESALEEAGYAVGEVVPGEADASATVATQEPVAGTSVARGGKVDLTLQPAQE